MKKSADYTDCADFSFRVQKVSMTKESASEQGKGFYWKSRRQVSSRNLRNLSNLRILNSVFWSDL